MGVVSTITIGADTFSVYAETASPLVDADKFFNGRFGSVAWDAETDINKSRALVSAARWLDRQRWVSVPTDVVTPQALEHPRVGLRDCNDTLILDTVVAQEIVDAEFELAQIILDDSAAQESAGEGTNTKLVKADTVEVEFFRNTEGTARDTAFPPHVHDLVKCFLGGSGLGIPSITGTGVASVFDDTSSFSRPLR